MADTNLFGQAVPAAHNIQSFIDGKMSAQATLLQFPEDRPKYYTTLDFTTYSFRTNAGGGLAQGLKDLTGINATPTNTGSITLPLPVNLIDKHSVLYDEKPIAAAVWTGIDNMVKGTIAMAGSFIGLAPNWYQTVMFDRPEFKRHELAFKLSPRNYQEAAMIRNIIWMINNAQAPAIAGPTGGGLLPTNAMLLAFPDIVKVILHPNSGFLYKFKPAVIEHFIVNYAGGGGQKAFYHDSEGGAGANPPESVEMTLHLIEIEYWLKGDFTTTNNAQAGQAGTIVS